MLKLLIILLIIFLASLVLTGLIRHLMLRAAVLDMPNERSLHNLPTPRGGGIVFVVLFFLAVIGLWWQHIITEHFLLALVGGGILVAAVGCWDDFKSVPARYRITIHFLAACWAIYWLGGFPVLLLGVWKIYLGWLGVLLAVIATVWLINLYNFMDGADGFAGTECISVSGFAGLLLWFGGQHSFACVCLVLVATITGFLVWNWPPAKIFMGDVGSGTLGFIFAVLIIASAHGTAFSPLIWFMLLAVFILDATFTVLRRMINREKLYLAHRSHAYQCLVGQGATHLQITRGLFLINLLVLLPLAYISLRHAIAAPWICVGVILIGLLLWRMITLRVKSA